MEVSKRKFYRQIFEVEVLSERPIGAVDDLGQLDYMITHGDYSGKVTEHPVEELDGKQAANALRDQASDPEFFQLTNDGEDIEDE